MRRVTRCLAFVCTLMPLACASTQFDRYFEARQWSDAAREFAADSTLRSDDRALFRAAQLFGSPDSDAFDPERARQLLDDLIRLHPGSKQVGPALTMIALLDEVQRVRNDVILRERELQAEIHVLAHDVEQLQERIRWLESRFVAQEEQNQTLRRIADRLEFDLRDRENQLRALQDELDRLKDIDLSPPFRSVPPEGRGRPDPPE